MKRKTWGLVLAALVIAATAGVLYYGTRVGGPTLHLALEPAALSSIDPATLTLPADTPPAQPRPAAGWPFQQLPAIAKLEIPTPVLALAPVAPPILPVLGKVPLPYWPPPPADEPTPPWAFLLPLAAGAAIGGADDVRSVVPEPSTLLLLSTGLLLLGAGAVGRRGRERTSGT